VRSSLGELIPFKERLIAVRLDDHDLFELGPDERGRGPATRFIERVVRLFAPIVTEIARRSPNREELSLKVETENGRREEIYLRKQELLTKLAPLGEDARAMFAPLALGKPERPRLDIRAELPSVVV